MFVFRLNDMLVVLIIRANRQASALEALTFHTRQAPDADSSLHSSLRATKLK